MRCATAKHKARVALEIEALSDDYDNARAVCVAAERLAELTMERLPANWRSDGIKDALHAQTVLIAAHRRLSRAADRLQRFMTYECDPEAVAA
jgi:hypothetical protein